MNHRWRHRLILLVILGLAIAALLWWLPAEPPAPQPVAPAGSEPAHDEPPAAIPQPLNIELPQEHLLVEPAINMEEPESPLKPLFRMEPKPSSVAVGGGLILEEDKSKLEPEAPVWDQVKGATVEVEVKID